MKETGVVHHLTHPLIQHKLTLMREKERSTSGFRRLLHEIAMLMAYEVTRDMPMQEIEIVTPLERTTGRVVAGSDTPIEATEVWTFARRRGADWELSAIQQTS